MSFAYDEKKRNVKMIRFPKEYNDLFYGDKGDGKYEDKKKHPYILQKGKNNFYKGIRDRYINEKSQWGNISKFFKSGYNIKLHSPTNTLSSQVVCLNHLFPIRNDKVAVEAIIKGLKINIKGESIEFDEVLPIKRKVYIDFEVSDPNNLLDENKRGGVGHTQIDALVCAKDKGGKIWVIVLEWKYTESYTTPIDRSVEDKKKKGSVPKEEKGEERWGKERMQRYNKLIQISRSLISLCKEMRDNNDYAGEYRNTVYYYEPYYELMRQTLWAELVIDKDKKKVEEFLEDASDYLHICVVPKANKALLDTGFGGVNNMEQTWRSYLTDDGSERFKIIDPEDLFEPLKDKKIYPDLVGHINYLKKRYWDNDIEENFEDVVNETGKTLRERDQNDIYKKRHADVVWEGYCDGNYLREGEKIKGVIEECGTDSVLQLYNSISRLESRQYDVRFCGQHICSVNVSEAEPKIHFEKNSEVDDKENNRKYFDIEEGKMKDEGSLADAEEFFGCFKPALAGNVKSPELRLQALIRGEMDKKESGLFENIEPVKVGAGFFVMPTPLAASELVPKIPKGGVSKGGHIDILAKVSCPNGGWMPAVIEVKDENNPDEPVEAVMTQALIYATFLSHLLTDKDCGEAWYNIIGGKGEDEKSSVPDTIDILVVAMMPPKKYGEPDKINETPIPLKKVGDKNIRLIPCTCYIDTDDNFTAINSVEWSCFKKNG